MVASELTTWRRADAAVLPEVMDQVDGRIDRFLADGAFDGQPTYDLLIGRRQELPIPEVIVPPRRADRVRSRELDMIRQRDRHIAYVQTHGKRAWQTATGYTRRNLIEAGVSRYKRIIGRRLRTRSLAAQRTETRIGVQVLNRMLDLGRPITQSGSLDLEARALSPPEIRGMHQSRSLKKRSHGGGQAGTVQRVCELVLERCPALT